VRDLESEGYWSYSDLIDSFEVEVLHQVDMNDYQGDSWLVLRDGSRYGYLVFGWGSCSGCDALEAAHDSLTDVTCLRDDLWNSIQWFPTAKELHDYLASKDGDLEWYGRESDFETFRTEALALLGNIA
jgi:hypothetical protein